MHKRRKNPFNVQSFARGLDTLRRAKIIYVRNERGMIELVSGAQLVKSAYTASEILEMTSGDPKVREEERAFRNLVNASGLNPQGK